MVAGLRLKVVVGYLVAHRTVASAWSTSSSTIVSPTSLCFHVAVPVLGPRTSCLRHCHGEDRYIDQLRRIYHRGACNGSKWTRAPLSVRFTGHPETCVDDVHTVTCDDYGAFAKRKQAQSHGSCSNQRQYNRYDAQLPEFPTELFMYVQAASVAGFILIALLGSSPADAMTTSGATTIDVAQSATVDVGAIFARAGKASFGGGISGAAAAVVQVLSLMWLRTTMNFQYKNGGSTKKALETLWKEGGVQRFYRGISFALIQGPLSRFGDTAANVGVLALLESFESTRTLPLPIKSAAGSFAAGLWRIGLTPIDCYKTTLQVSGAEGLSILGKKVAVNGPGVLFEGALASATATFVGHYPWYFTYNSLGAWLPPAPGGEALVKLGRQAFLGLCSSCVSDCCSNSVRVVKTTKQTSSVPISYPEVLKQVVDEDGIAGLFFRGLQTRLLVNALQGALFAVAWKYFEELFKTGALGS